MIVLVPPSFLLLLFLVCSIFVLLVEAPHSHSRRSSSSIGRGRNRGSVQYDRSISIFSDDGRLLQVEYGAEASNKGGTVACLKLNRKSTSSFVCFAIDTVTPGESSLSFSDKVHRVDDHCVLVTTGLAGDCRFLAQTTRLACQKHRLKNGEPPSILEIANMVAQTQHELTRTSGSRPLGVTVTVAGVDPFITETTTASNGVSSIRLFQCEVGGVVDECEFCASGQAKKSAAVALSKLQQNVILGQQQLDGGDAGNDHSLNEFFSIEAQVEGVARAILDSDGSAGRVDIWLIQKDSSCRGNARFRFAKAVSSEELETVAKLLLTSK